MKRSALLRRTVVFTGIIKLCALFAFPSLFVKKASESRVDLETVGLTESLVDTFFILKLLIKPFQVLGFSTPISISLTMLLITLLFHLRLCSLAENKIWRNGYRAQRMLLLVVLFSPAVNFFSLVALRDALLYVLVAFAIAEIFARNWRQNQKNSILLLLAVVSIFLLRPEMAIVIAGVAVIVLCSKTFLRALLALFFSPLLIIATGYAASLTASYSLNMDIMDPFVMLDQIRESRYQRQFRSDGSGSAIMPALAWSGLGTFEKYAAQVAATLFMPLSLSSLNYSLVALDSALLLLAITLTVFATRTMPMRRLKILTLLASIIFVVLLLAPFVVNFGNGFRLRLILWAVVTGAALALVTIAPLGKKDNSIQRN